MPHPEGETGTCKPLLAASAEQKKCTFFPRSGQIVLFWGVLVCCDGVLLVVVIDICLFCCVYVVSAFS